MEGVWGDIMWYSVFWALYGVVGSWAGGGLGPQIFNRKEIADEAFFWGNKTE